MSNFPEIYSPILISGCQGQLGSVLCNSLQNKHIACSRKHLDLSKPETISNIVKKLAPKAIINSASYNQVDKAETEHELAEIINHLSVTELAKTAFELGIPFIHVSTDYVFSGEGNTPWVETDKTNPQNAYGLSKRNGEDAIQKLAKQYDNAQWFIFRTSWVYDAHHANFLNTMLNLAKTKESLNIVNDQIGAPTYAPDLADAILSALAKSAEHDAFPSSIYHVANAGETSWHGFASSIIEKARDAGEEISVKSVEAIPSHQYPTAASRPKNSRLNCKKIKETFGISLPSWQDALTRCITEKYKTSEEAV